MNRFYKYNNKVIGLAVAALTFTACADQWDDHYSDNALPGTNSGTVWQAMENNPELSNFRRVAEACGYDKSLKSSQMFSVFAPTNSHFTAEQADSVINLYKKEVAAGTRTADNRAIREFLQNHIARYTHSVADAASFSDSVVMMNGKYILLNQEGFGGRKLITKNQLYENGVLFSIDKPASFYNNVFEYIDKDRTNQPDGLDSIANFLYSKRYYRYELDEAQSVPGDIVNGKTTYLDSVMVKENELFYRIGELNDEDSTYIMTVPTNREWDKLVKEYEQYFMYHEKVDKYDSLRWAMPRIQIVASGIFSLTSNVALRNQLNGGAPADSILSTWAYPGNERKYAWGSDTLHYYQYGTKKNPQDPFAAGGTFYNAEQVKCSNGMIMKTDKWNINKTNTFLRQIVVEAENARTIIVDDKQTQRRKNYVTVPSWSKYHNKLSGNSYLEVFPYDRSISDPEVTFILPNVLSNVKYDMYMITVPADAADSTVMAENLKPTRYYISRLYKELDGNGPERDSITNNRDGIFDKDKYLLADLDGTLGKGQGCGTDVDTICLAKGVEFPTCAWGTNSQVQLRVLNWVDYDPTNTYDRTIRIDCIILRPQEFGPLKADEE